MENNEILIVDDDDLLLFSLKHILSKIGYEVVLAENATSALKLLCENPRIVAVISDVLLPDMSGIDLLKKVREKEINTPFIFLSGHSDKNDVIQAIKMGAMDFMEKPVKKDSLIKVVTHAAEIGVIIKAIKTEMTDPDNSESK
jgi:two-component system C4-dicarboxylate transport response regulator DctD